MEYQNSTLHRDLDCGSMVKLLCSIAKKGLAICYSENTNPLPYTCRPADNNVHKLVGSSFRYAIISQIGIAEWLKTHPEDRAHLPNLWPKIIDNYHNITDIGDLALVLWAAVANKADNCELLARTLSTSWQSQANLCNAVELGWIIQACTLALSEQGHLKPHIGPVLNQAKTNLVSLFRPQRSLFQRHNRAGIAETISRRIACFADQVYPILAMSTYGLLFNDKQSIEIAARATEKICRLQGPLGQWWWHYDTSRGEVSEEYPVFSVHQHAMAPMAIMASDKASGENHLERIKCSIRWLLGDNELHTNLLLDEAGIIWRDIEKREPVKLSRGLRSLLCISNLHSLNKLAGKCFIGFRINYECRPYELGWILYTWANSRSESET